MPDAPDHILLICSTCRDPEATRALRQALQAQLPERFVIRDIACMAGCERPATVGFQAHGKAHYLFGDIAGDRDIAALVAFAHQYSRSADGWTNATDRPPALLHKTLARLPRLEPVAAS